MLSCGIASAALRAIGGTEPTGDGDDTRSRMGAQGA
jgi:hypothetical protein